MQWANRWAKHQWTCFGWGSSREPPIEPKFFLVLLTSYSHLFNTEPRFFDHFLNFPARANVYAPYFQSSTHLELFIIKLVQENQNMEFNIIYFLIKVLLNPWCSFFFKWHSLPNIRTPNMCVLCMCKSLYLQITMHLLLEHWMMVVHILYYIHIDR